VPPNQQPDVPHFAGYRTRLGAFSPAIIAWVGATDRAISGHDEVGDGRRSTLSYCQGFAIGRIVDGVG
jgi:hypothetical protein